MSIQHVSRTGKTYYLHVVAGKTGKSNYHFSTRPGPTQASSVPDGFEIYEKVNGQVFLQRKTAPIITDQEVALVKAALKRQGEEWNYQVEVKKEMVIIHEANDISSGLERLAMPWVSKATLQSAAIQCASYTAVLRFMLADKAKRLFRAERFCFRGSVDDWIDIGGAPEELPAVVKKYVKHLGKESMFEQY